MKEQRPVTDLKAAGSYPAAVVRNIDDRSPEDRKSQENRLLAVSQGIRLLRRHLMTEDTSGQRLSKKGHREDALAF